MSRSGAPMAGNKDAAAKRRQAAGPGKLPAELLANIHDRLEFLDRIAFATVFATSCDDVLSLPTPWLVLPCDKDKHPAIATLFSVDDRRAATVRAPDPTLRDYVVLGSSHGWLATGDNQGQIHLVNPATGEQHTLPDIATMGVFVPGNDRRYFSVWIERFLAARFGGGPPFGDNWWGPEGHGRMTYSAVAMRTRFYRKVVLSIERRPGRQDAMLILNESYGAPAFAAVEDGGAWRVARSREGIEDAIHHDGRFHSVSYSGLVEAWECDSESGAYTSTSVAPRLTTGGGEGMSSRKYLAAAPDGRLMVVVKNWTKERGYLWNKTWTCSFEVHVLGHDGQWAETRDIGDAALFVGLNNSLCVPKMGRPEIEAGCVYYTDDQLWEAAVRKRNKDIKYTDDDDDDYVDIRPAGVYSLKDGTVKKIDALGPQVYRGFTPTPPVWITPSIP